jgi:hypothetical protein
VVSLKDLPKSSSNPVLTQDNHVQPTVLNHSNLSPKMVQYA